MNEKSNGERKKWLAGGAVSEGASLNRRHSEKREHTKRLANGEMEMQIYLAPKLANPGTVLRVDVGGGRLGSDLAHSNEAPYPEGVPEFFIKTLCPPGGRVLDPFSGSGTTVSVARRLGRVGIGFDLRFSQCELGRRRLAEPPKVVKPKRATVPKMRAAVETLTLFDEVA